MTRKFEIMSVKANQIKEILFAKLLIVKQISEQF
jgi:hypothetical protein